MESILTSIKALLGPGEAYDHFDPDIIMHINTTLSILTQLGVGPVNGFSIIDKSATWNDFMGDDPRMEFVKTFVYIKVKLVFDPPLSASVLESLTRTASELEWRIQIGADPV